MQDHITNARLLTNPATIAAIEARVGRFALFVQAAPHLTVTEGAPRPVVFFDIGTLNGTLSFLTRGGNGGNGGDGGAGGQGGSGGNGTTVGASSRTARTPRTARTAARAAS